MVCIEGRDRERMVRGASRYLSGVRRILLAHVLDERALRGYDLALRGLLGRRQPDSGDLLREAEAAALEMLEEGRSLLSGALPGTGVEVEVLLLRGRPEHELVRAAEEHGVSVLVLGRGAGDGGPVVVSGRISGWRRNPRGEVDGFYLEDGAEVRFPPHRGAQIKAALHEGENVEVRGERRPRHVHAHLVVSLESGASLEAHPPERGPARRRLGHVARFVTDHAGCNVMLIV